MRSTDGLRVENEPHEPREVENESFQFYFPNKREASGEHRIVIAMATITDFRCVDENDKEIPSDAFGNNVALACPTCGYPTLAIVRDNQRGADANNPAVCRKCQAKVWLSIDTLGGLLRVHQIKST